jgi:hypothetical protein
VTEETDSTLPADQQVSANQPASADQQAPAQPADGQGESGEVPSNPYGIWMEAESIRGSGPRQGEITRDAATPESRKSQRDG